MSSSITAIQTEVRLYSQFSATRISDLLTPFGLIIKEISTNSLSQTQSIPGSYWGESEAGLIANKLYIRGDTPIHSLLHEACHYICMDKNRRNSLDTDAGGDYDEENAVCYLQILLSEHLENFNRNAMFKDMDTWGYTFRLGSAQRWFQEDAQDAKKWLLDKNIINHHEQVSFKINTK